MAYNPFLRNYGQDYFPQLGMEERAANQMALLASQGDRSKGNELAAALMEAQYGPGGSSRGGRFGGYLRSQAGNLGSILGLFDQLSIGSAFGSAGGSAERGGAYKTFEDLYESLGAGRGTSRPGQFNIADWMNMLYGGQGAARGAATPGGGGILGGGQTVADLGEPTSMAEAQAYIDSYLRPLLGGTVSQGKWDMIAAALPRLFNEWNQLQGGGGPLWASWLRDKGYLPSQAL